MDTLYIDAFDVGGGLYIQHGFATMIADNVTITCGVKVFGAIHVGNNVIVGANAVVTKDVPDNCVVGGVPAKELRSNSG